MTELATIHRLPVHRQVEAELTYRQLALELGCSLRLVKQMHAEGLPDIGLDAAGRRRFRLSDARPFVAERNRRLGRV